KVRHGRNRATTSQNVAGVRHARALTLGKGRCPYSLGRLPRKPRCGKENRNMLNRKRTLGLAVWITLLAGAASALPRISIKVDAGAPQDVTASGTFTPGAPAPGSSYSWAISPGTPVTGGGLINQWSVTLRESYADPAGVAVSNNITLQNTTGSDHIYL